MKIQKKMGTQSKERIKQTGIMGFYISYKTVVALAAFILFAVYMRDALVIRFMANVPLNTIIIATMFVSIGIVLRNTLALQGATKLIRRIEIFEDAPTEEESMAIFHALRKKGRLINVFYLYEAVLALKYPGHLIFDDKQTSVIKNKVGQRTMRMRHHAQYLAGVLVMLGLIGTFWGLLETITAVGEAMSKIVDSFSHTVAGTTDADAGNGMAEFLVAISKPLQGMGIAFSASLFGLSGSLITGLLNSFCAKGMDSFMEDFSVWLDTRIQLSDVQNGSLNPVEIIEAHNRSVVKALQEALDGIAQQSQQMFGTLSGLMTELTQFSSQQMLLTKQLNAEKYETTRIANTFDAGLDMQSTIYNNLLLLLKDRQGAPDSQAQIAQTLDKLHESTVEQKDKMIEMLLTMQRILQVQASQKPGTENILNPVR